MAEYKATLVDKHGAAAVDRIRAVVYGAMVFGLTLGSPARHGAQPLCLRVGAVAGATTAAIASIAEKAGGL